MGGLETRGQPPMALGNFEVPLNHTETLNSRHLLICSESLLHEDLAEPSSSQGPGCSLAGPGSVLSGRVFSFYGGRF